MQHTNLTQRLLWLGTIILGVVLADQLIKRWIVDWLGPGSPTFRFEILGSLFAFEYLENRGAAFGLFQQSTMVLAVVSVAIIAVALGILVRVAIDDMWEAVAIAVIIGGAVGNAIDRFVRGFVVDYIAIGNFWKFNLADSAVTIGIALLFILLWRSERAAKSESVNRGIHT